MKKEGAVSKCSSNTKTTPKMATPVSCTKPFSLKRAVVVLGARSGAEEAEVGVARQRARLYHMLNHLLALYKPHVVKLAALARELRG